MISKSRAALLRERSAFQVAPMMDYTDAHFRYFFRLLSKRSMLYTEMVTANALVHSQNPDRFLQGVDDDNLVLQLGGSCPIMMKKAAQIAYNKGFRNFNINCGCPSSKVAGSGQFGARLMQNPIIVKEMADAISQVSGKSTSIKCRIGIDNEDQYEFLHNFVEIVSAGGGDGGNNPVDHFIIHARKAILGGIGLGGLA